MLPEGEPRKVLDSALEAGSNALLLPYGPHSRYNDALVHAICHQYQRRRRIHTKYFSQLCGVASQVPMLGSATFSIVPRGGKWNGYNEVL